MEKEYSTKEIADEIGIHPNTVRLYEKIGFLTSPKRKSNNYRTYTELHVTECRLIRCTLRCEVLQRGLRRKAVGIIILCAKLRFEEGIRETLEYREMLNSEIRRVNETIHTVEGLIASPPKEGIGRLSRNEVARELGITVDTLRSWELNGLVESRKAKNGYRYFTEGDMKRLIIIRTLRCADYSLASILRLLRQLDRDEGISVDKALNYPVDASDIVTACDHLKEMLDVAVSDTMEMEKLIKKMKKINPPL